MPELPEVETVRRRRETTVRGRTVRAASISGLRLRAEVPATLPRRLRGRTITALDRRGKFLFVHFDQGLTLLSHLGMSGRWLFQQGGAAADLAHVHLRIAFADGTALWFQDPRRFGLLRLVRTDALAADPALARLGPDPIASPPTGAALRALARGTRVGVKTFLLDQRRLAGIGNIYASEILHRARVDPRRRAGGLSLAEWNAVAATTSTVLHEAIDRMGTTFSTFRTLWNEPGAYGDQLRVYDRAGAPCRRCGTAIRRIVQGQRSTYFCPGCQHRGTAPPRRRARTEAAF